MRETILRIYLPFPTTSYSIDKRKILVLKGIINYVTWIYVYERQAENTKSFLKLWTCMRLNIKHFLKLKQDVFIFFNFRKVEYM